jgi:hypothetical protein
MEIKDIAAVLDSIKRREIEHNIKVNRLCNNPSRSIGEKAIDEAIAILTVLSNSGLTLEEIVKLAKVKKDGLLVELPCKVGDTVYEPLAEWDGTECMKDKFKPHIRERMVTYFAIGSSGKVIAECRDVGGFRGDFLVFGERAFLTREEAEAALKRTEEK